jgi:hypothetical protein
VSFLCTYSLCSALLTLVYGAIGAALIIVAGTYLTYFTQITCAYAALIAVAGTYLTEADRQRRRTTFCTCSTLLRPTGREDAPHSVLAVLDLGQQAEKTHHILYLQYLT